MVVHKGHLWILALMLCAKVCGAPRAPKTEEGQAFYTLEVTLETALEVKGSAANVAGAKECIATHLTPRYVKGPIIRVDLGALSGAVAKKTPLRAVKLKIEVSSTQRDTIVLIANGANLATDVEFIASIPVYVSGSYNDVSGRVASIVSPAKVIPVIEDF